MSVRGLIPGLKCGSSPRVSLQEEDPIAVFVGSSNGHVQLELSSCPQLIISLSHFGLDPFTGVLPWELMAAVKSYLHFQQQVTCDNPTASKTTSTSTEKQTASCGLNKTHRKHHQIITTCLLRGVSQSK